MPFKEINETEVEETNNQVDQELNRKRPRKVIVETKPSRAREIIGTITGAVGTLGLTLGIVGASTLLLSSLVGWTGLGLLWISLIAIGVGLLFTTGGFRISTGSWFPQQGVLV